MVTRVEPCADAGHANPFAFPQHLTTQPLTAHPAAAAQLQTPAQQPSQKKETHSSDMLPISQRFVFCCGCSRDMPPLLRLLT